MLVSVIIPVYNVEKYLQRCLDSVLKQTKRELEIILVNDGSTDNSLQICESYAQNDKRIKIIDQKNAGPANARNNGIKVAKGDYIGFIDSDDEVKVDFLEKLAKAAAATGADVICSDIIIDNGTEQKQVRNSYLRKDKLFSADEIKNEILQKYYGGFLENIPSMYNKLYNLNFLKSNNILIQESRIRAEDYWFNFEVLCKANSFFAVDYAGYIYKVAVPGSIMKSFRANQFEGFLQTRAELLQHNKQLKLKVNTVKWDTEFINNTQEFIREAIKHKNYDLVNQILKNTEYKAAIKNAMADKLHTKLIKFFAVNKLNLLELSIYKIWAKKA